MKTKTKVSKDLKFKRNPRKITDAQLELLRNHLSELGDLSGVIYCHNNKAYVGGNQRSDVFDNSQIEITERFSEPTKQKTLAHGFIVWQGEKYAYREVAFTEQEFKKACIVANHDGGSWDMDILRTEFDIPELAEWGFEVPEFETVQIPQAEYQSFREFQEQKKEVIDNTVYESKDAEPQVNKAKELNEKWRVRKGDMFSIGRHKLLCGDSTLPEDALRLMGNEKAVLCHADPPYGMGKENEGIQNDNLYREKLDIFQMQWWQAFRKSLEDNASVYIWGNPESLWRLWFLGGLKDSERLTFRNEIVWNKYNSSCKPTVIEMMRSYCNYTERCLFFILGEQGFNNNADNYWEGWETIRLYLEKESDKMSLTQQKIKEICGVGMYSHWFTKSQWTFIPKEHYLKLQSSAQGVAFKREYDELKREYDELKREFYSTRAYFDNTHENMTDVWDFSRVQGDDRYGHATPKPVDMIMRIIKSSSQENDIICEPFLGSGTTMIAAQNLNRRCFGMELSESYCAVVLERIKNAYPDIEISLCPQP